MIKQKSKYSTGVYSFLDKEGVLENNDVGLIKAAKRQYWLDYKKKWNKVKRKQCKLFTILFNQQELKALTKAAEEYNTSPTNFIKQSALAFSNKANLADLSAVGEIRELLALHYNFLQSLTEEDTLSHQLVENMLSRIINMEKEVLGALWGNSENKKLTNNF